ncbi:MAG: VOC family protein [Acidimicrobiales bacterium]|nr:VOC family protein [Acidimicrobiales bacterium]
MMTTTEEHDTNAATMPAVTGIQHVGLTVTDVEASCAWYERVLGLQRQFQEAHHHSDQGGYAVVLGTSDMSLNVGLDHHPANGGESFDATRTGLDHVCFSVESVEALDRWAAHLDRQGVAHSGAYPMEGMPISLLTFLDPDGIQVELIAFGQD